MKPSVIPFFSPFSTIKIMSFYTFSYTFAKELLSTQFCSRSSDWTASKIQFLEVSPPLWPLGRTACPKHPRFWVSSSQDCCFCPSPVGHPDLCAPERWLEASVANGQVLCPERHSLKRCRGGRPEETRQLPFPAAVIQACHSGTNGCVKGHTVWPTNCSGRRASTFHS